MKIDISELKSLLDDTTQKMKSTKDKIEINTIMENLITTVMNAEFASLWVFDMQNALLLRERSSDSVREISMLDQRGVLAKCFFTLTGGIYNYLASEKEYRPQTDNPDKIKMKSKIIVPMLDGERLIGIVTAYASVQKKRSFDEDDLELLETMVPYLINVVYRMHPHTKEDDSERVYIGERLRDESRNVIEKAEEIQQVQKTVQESVQKPDDTLSFLSNTVHDIRTPANTLYGFLELLEDQLDNPRLLQYIHSAKESANFINDLTTSILDRVSSQRERAQAKPVQLSPTKFFADIAETFSANMFNKKISFNIFIDPSLPKEIIIEDVILKRVLINLISNAYKFTPSKKTINFSVLYQPSTTSLNIAIQDTGIGIAKEKQDEIFKEFTQAEDNTNMTYGGTGLGLSISAQYVKDLGGKLQIESELNVGSTFHFDIPVNVANKTATLQPIKNKNIYLEILLNHKNVASAKNLKRYLLKMGLDEKNIVPTQDSSKLSPKTTHLVCFQEQLTDDIIALTQKQNIELIIMEESFLSLIQNDMEEKLNIISQYGYYANTLYTFIQNRSQMKILIADDDKINLNLIKAMLENEFCLIETVKDGGSALTMLKDGVKNGDPYSLVYLDHHMPELSGIEVITQFRAFEKKENVTPVFAVNISGDPSGKDVNDTPFDLFVTKPFNKKKIQTALEKAMKKT